MKNFLMMIIALAMMTSSIFADLISDPGFDVDVTAIKDITGGPTDLYYDQYPGEEWIVFDTGTYRNVTGGNPGQCVRLQNGTEFYKYVATVIDDNAVSTGSDWAYTLDLQDYNSAITVETTLNLVVRGLDDPWNAKAWKNRISFNSFTFDSDTGVDLLNIFINPTNLDSSWKTFTGPLDLGGGYEYIAIGLRINNVGVWNSSLRVDNFDIKLIPEPGGLWIIGLLELWIIVKRRMSNVKI